MSRQRVCLLRGDGIGYDLLEDVERVLEHLAPDLRLDEAPVGMAAFQRTGAALPAASLEAVRNADACLLVAVGSPSEPTPGYRSPVVGLRRELDLFANVRPVTSLPGDPGPAVNLVVVRENTEGLYAGRERRDGDRAVAERVITVQASRRIARYAGELAAGRSGRVAVVHKANVLRETCGLFREVALAELARIGGLEVTELLVDHAAMRVAEEPHAFDVIVTTNLFGDILSDVAALAGGGLGLASSANLGTGSALFEPVHGSAPDLSGRNLANPTATLRAVAWMLAHLDRTPAAARLTAAIERTLAEGPTTPDLGGTAGTSEVTDAILGRLCASEGSHPITTPSL